MIRPALSGLVAGLILLAAAGSAGAEPAVPSGCAAPDALAAIEPALAHAAAKIERGDKQPGEKLKIVAIGSSSTSGSGASAPNLTYPARLEAELRERYPHLDVIVVNRGKGGEDAAQELARFDRDVFAERPDLVIWQLGTNAVLRRDDVSGDGELIRRGVEQLTAAGADVVLMDMQYAPRVLARPGHVVMERLIAEAAASTHVGLFRRFELMRYWHDTPLTEAAPMIGPDGLHMTDRGYYCLAAELADALADNWRAHREAARRARTVAVSGSANKTVSARAVAP
jgi:lysophospholipase L1-like esterase